LEGFNTCIASLLEVIDFGEHFEKDEFCKEFNVCVASLLEVIDFGEYIEKDKF